MCWGQGLALGVAACLCAHRLVVLRRLVLAVQVAVVGVQTAVAAVRQVWRMVVEVLSWCWRRLL